MSDEVSTFSPKSGKKQSRKKQTVPQGFLVLSVKQGGRMLPSFESAKGSQT